MRAYLGALLGRLIPDFDEFCAWLDNDEPTAEEFDTSQARDFGRA